MALFIKNVEVERLARELAKSRGVPVTEAIRQSLENETARENLTSQQNESDLIARLMEISEQAGRIPDRDRPMAEDEVLGYGELEIPSR
ncbi:type II toxin-antitoxin system VapB family antitoxin [Mesorhizobium sp. B2-3-10]|uniref:type II toxin-antitoxin system VapB family antitoxin n=1 Tax=Mesorhizobium sp. B2-3-10 TaxID=2589954 RepID=UPI0015E3E530|nr:type II toxin-antitoxin system VapB family antitoxin [Mesorhizobium sp. B2-3-10]